MNLNELQEKILLEFRDLQCYEDFEDEDDPGGNTKTTYRFNDEGYLMLYKRLESDLGVSRARLQVEVREMRDMGLIELCPAVDPEYPAPSGSGWSLTKKGIELINDKAKSS